MSGAHEPGQRLNLTPALASAFGVTIPGGEIDDDDKVRLPIFGERRVDFEIRRLLSSESFGEFLLGNETRMVDEDGVEYVMGPVADFIDQWTDPGLVSISHAHQLFMESGVDDDPVRAEQEYGALSAVDDFEDLRDRFLLQELRKQGLALSGEDLRHRCHLPFEGLEMPEHAGVYVLAVGPGVAKIGVAKSIRGRCKAAQTYCPTEVQLLAWFPGGRAEEAALHKRFERQRMRGELFRLSGPLINIVRERRKELGCDD